MYNRNLEKKIVTISGRDSLEFSKMVPVLTLSSFLQMRRRSFLYGRLQAQRQPSGSLVPCHRRIGSLHLGQFFWSGRIPWSWRCLTRVIPVWTNLHVKYLIQHLVNIYNYLASSRRKIKPHTQKSSMESPFHCAERKKHVHCVEMRIPFWITVHLLDGYLYTIERLHHEALCR